MNISYPEPIPTLCIDMKSFFASCECVMRGLNPSKDYVVVVGDSSKDHSLVLASSPMMKRHHGVKTGARLGDVKKIKDPKIHVFQARMNEYLSMSKKVESLFETFVPKSQLTMYSVDEGFLTLHGTERLWGTPMQTAVSIQKALLESLGLPACVGIGDNVFLAKVALDVYAKEKPNGIASLRYENVSSKLHPLEVSEIWGIGPKTTQTLHQFQIFTMKDLSTTPINTLKKQFGINGVKLFWQAWGIDKSVTIQNTFGKNKEERVQSMSRELTLEEATHQKQKLLLYYSYLLDDLLFQLRNDKKNARTIRLAFTSSQSSTKQSKQKTIPTSSNLRSTWKPILKQLLFDLHPTSLDIRKIGLSFSQLEPQMPYTSQKEKQEAALAAIQDTFNHKYGKGILTNAEYLKEKSFIQKRNQKKRGHFET